MRKISKQSGGSPCKTRSIGAVIVSKDGRVCVVSQFRTSTSLPKGHVEGNEDDFATLKREVHEETGIDDLKMVGKLGTYTRYSIAQNGKDDFSEVKDVTIYLCTTKKEVLRPLDPDKRTGFPE